MSTYIDSTRQIHRKNIEDFISVSKVTSIIDKALKSQGRDYFALRQANKALKDSNSFTIAELHSDFLKQMLETGQIMHTK